MNRTAAFEPDALDWRILDALQHQGRLTFDELASQVGLSPSAALRRVRRLEELGVITGYVALLDPQRVGLGLTAFINVRLEKHRGHGRHDPREDFHAAVQGWVEVVECVSLSGEMDYQLKVQVRDMAHHARFVMDTLLRHPSVQDCRSSFAMQWIKQTTALPLKS